MKGYLKELVRGAYDIQQIRIQIGLRIVSNFKTQLGQGPGEKEDTMEIQAQNILSEIRKSYKKLTDGLSNFPVASTFKGDNIISDFTVLCLVSQYISIEEQEKKHFARLKHPLSEHKIWTEYLEKVKGVGPAIAGIIISEVDISKSKYPSSLWRYAGLDVAEDGKGRSRKKEHLIEVEYIDKEGEIKMKKGITFNPFLKTKLIGVLGGSFLKMGDNKYSLIYRKYKTRLENHKIYKDSTKGHRHNMAIRYMIKMFLVDLHIKWREFENLPVAVPYSEGKLGLVHTE